MQVLHWRGRHGDVAPRRRHTGSTALLTVLALGAVSAPSPASAAPGDGVIAWAEVEDGVITGNPGRDSGDHGNFSGTGSYTFRETGMRSTMTVTAQTAGTYPLYVRYAAGPTDAPETRTMGLLTNGADRKQLQLSYTGDWETWRFVESTVTLRQGLNTVALDCNRPVDTCRLNFDAIQVGGAEPDACAAVPTRPGYTALFDGTFASFDGWRKAGGGGFGRQTDCTIRTLRGRGATWFTTQQSASYALKVDWRRAATDDESGVYVASGGAGNADPSGGFRIPIGTETGSIVPTGGAADPADAGTVAPALRPVGEWNTYTVLLTGRDVAVYLNGALVNTSTSPDAIPRGFVGLENRGDGHDVSFRNIQVSPTAVQGSTTTVEVAPGGVEVGGTATVTVDVSTADRTPTGQADVYVDGVKSSTVTLQGGTATATVGPFPTAGTRSVEATYLGDVGTEVSPSNAARVDVRATPAPGVVPPAPVVAPAPSVIVQKSVPTLEMRVRPGRVVAGRTRAKVTVAVSAPGRAPSGRMSLVVRGRTYSVRLVDGTATFELAKLKRAGATRLRASYTGDATTTSASTATTIRVRTPTR